MQYLFNNEENSVGLRLECFGKRNVLLATRCFNDDLRKGHDEAMLCVSYGRGQSSTLSSQLNFKPAWATQWSLIDAT